MRPLALLTAMVLPLLVAAAVPPSPSGRAALARFNALDRNGDGALDTDELLGRGRAAAADALFAWLDADGDGQLAVAEMQRRRGSALTGRFDAYDGNRDGTVTRREFPAGLDPRLAAALDGDGDHRLSLAEVRPAFAGMRPRPRQAEPPRRHRPAAAARAWCWVPAFGDRDGWGLEMPASGAVCPTNGAR